MSHRVLFGCMVAGLAFSTQVFAAEGKFDMRSCYSGPSNVVQQGDGITAGSYDVTAMMPGQEGTPYYNMSGRCLGQFTIINGDYSETGSCQFWNAGGDKIFGVYTRKGDPAKAEGNWHVVQGTGKLTRHANGRCSFECRSVTRTLRNSFNLTSPNLST
jgi:hypothetical protein